MLCQDKHSEQLLHNHDEIKLTAFKHLYSAMTPLVDMLKLTTRKNILNKMVKICLGRKYEAKKVGNTFNI